MGSVRVGGCADAEEGTAPSYEAQTATEVLERYAEAAALHVDRESALGVM